MVACLHCLSLEYCMYRENESGDGTHGSALFVINSLVYGKRSALELHLRSILFTRSKGSLPWTIRGRRVQRATEKKGLD